MVQGTRDRGQQGRRAQKGRQQRYSSAARACSRPPPPPEVRAEARRPGGSSELGSPAPRPAAQRRGQKRAYLSRVPRSTPTDPAAAPPACGYCASQGSGHGVEPPRGGAKRPTWPERARPRDGLCSAWGSDHLPLTATADPPRSARTSELTVECLTNVVCAPQDPEGTSKMSSSDHCHIMSSSQLEGEREHGGAQALCLKAQVWKPHVTLLLTFSHEEHIT
nr:uncharacterized protein LOC107034417 [Vicugna pacos]